MESKPPLITEYLFKDPQTQKDPREDTLHLCKQLAIDPSTISFKEAKDFKDGDMADVIGTPSKSKGTDSRQDLVDIRFFHYNQKRLKNLNTLDREIR